MPESPYRYAIRAARVLALASVALAGAAGPFAGELPDVLERHGLPAAGEAEKSAGGEIVLRRTGERWTIVQDASM